MNACKLEIACFNLPSAIIAQQGGADRVELCDDISVGGITPDYSIIKEAKQKVHIHLFVMIRAKGPGFTCTNEEFQSMKKDIEFCKTIGVDGVVFGILNSKNEIDVARNKELLELAKPLPCSFHRAFDRVENPTQALEQIIDCGFSRILCSGSLTNAVDGVPTLTKLVKHANGRIIIMPGGGVRSSNISLIKENTNALEFHSSAITDKTEIANQKEVQLLKQNLA